MPTATPTIAPAHTSGNPYGSLLAKDSSNLDLLRSVAVLAVLAAHLLATFGLHRMWTSALGWSGVLFFFVHTCLVLMMSMERLAVTGWRLFASFYVRRIFRIYPLSMCCIVAVVVLKIPSMPWVPHFEPASINRFVSNMLLIQNLTWQTEIIGALWSLPLELQMYVVLPLLFLAARRFASPAMGIGLWIVFVPLGIVIPTLHQLQFGGVAIFQYIPCFLGGVVAYQCSKRMPARRAFWLWPVTILAIMMVYVGFQSHSRGWIECLALGLALPQFRDTNMVWLRKASHAIAQHSYGIYLLHPPLMWLAFIRLHDLSPGIQWAVFLLSMTALCYAAFRWIESPLLKMGGNLAKRFDVRKAAGPAVAETRAARAPSSAEPARTADSLPPGECSYAPE